MCARYRANLAYHNIQPMLINASKNGTKHGPHNNNSTLIVEISQALGLLYTFELTSHKTENSLTMIHVQWGCALDG